MTDRELLELALEALELEDMTIALLTAEQPAQQEPVACIIDGDLYFHHEIDWEDLAYQGHGVELLYTSPPASKPWVGLTDEEIERVCIPLGAAMLSFTEVARAIEAKLKEKNCD